MPLPPRATRPLWPYYLLLVETSIYYEKFYAYVSPGEPLFHSNEIDLKEIDIHKVWLLNNIHCLSSKVGAEVFPAVRHSNIV